MLLIVNTGGETIRIRLRQQLHVQREKQFSLIWKFNKMSKVMNKKDASYVEKNTDIILNPDTNIGILMMNLT